MPLIYVFAASKMEARPVLALTAIRGAVGPKNAAITVGEGGNRCVVMITGIGTGNARAKANTALGAALPNFASGLSTVEKPAAVLVIGLCGGLTEGLPGQRLVTYTACLSTESAKLLPLGCSPVLTDAIVETLQRRRITCDRVVGITSPRIATTRSERLALAKSGAAVVDMETYEIISAAARAEVPAAVLRIVSDSMKTPMPDFNRAVNAAGGVDKRKALWIALGSPLQTLRLLGANRRAMGRLGAAVKLIFQSNCFQESETR